MKTLTETQILNILELNKDSMYEGTYTQLTKDFKDALGLYYYNCINVEAELQGNADEGFSCPQCGCFTISPEDDGMTRQYKEITFGCDAIIY